MTHLYDVRDSAETGRSANYIAFGDVDNDGDIDAFTSPFMYLTAPTRPPLSDLPEILLNDGHGVGSLDLAVGYWWVQPPFMRPFGQQPQRTRRARGGHRGRLHADASGAHDVAERRHRGGGVPRALEFV
ncbi:MAG: hypothetical protein WCJ30_15830 [Deltaproteobacteria bacterium]